MIIKTIVLFAMFTVSFSYAAIDSEYIDFSKLDLNSYKNVDGEKLTIESADTHGKGKDNVFFVFQMQASDKDNEKILKYHLFDLNSDGKIDLVKHFNLGKLAKSEADLDFDGKADVVTEFDTNTGQVVKKTENDGKSNIWRYWHKGEMRLKEMDRNSDKKPDVWIHYRSGQVIKTEVDVDFDGKNIRVQEN